jgi:hypothetical protein
MFRPAEVIFRENIIKGYIVDIKVTEDVEKYSKIKLVTKHGTNKL